VLVPELWPYWREPATPRAQVLDETFDGLDEASRGALRGELAARLDGAEWSRRALMLITHHAEELFGREGGGGGGGGAECEEQVLAPTHALLLGQGDGGTAWHAGPWEAMAPRLAGYFDAQREKQWVMPSSPPPRRASAVGGGTAAVAAGEALIDFRNLRVSYGSHVVFDGGLSWLVREGEKWVVHGGNGTGKSTLVELITGDNVLGYAQEHLHLFGKQKGSGESVWQIRAQLGVLSTEFHMQYIDYADPTVRTAFRKPELVTTWEVVCSGFFDSVGLYSEVTIDQRCISYTPLAAPHKLHPLATHPYYTPLR
jgi:ABC-type molybdenum transport system ATPase subunit/photorepair protein PhrA